MSFSSAVEPTRIVSLIPHSLASPIRLRFAIKEFRGAGLVREVLFRSWVHVFFRRQHILRPTDYHSQLASFKAASVNLATRKSCAARFEVFGRYILASKPPGPANYPVLVVLGVSACPLRDQSGAPKNAILSSILCG